MLEYLKIYFIQRSYGNSYIITQITYAVVTVLMLSNVSFTVKNILKKLGEIVLCIFLFFFGEWCYLCNFR